MIGREVTVVVLALNDRYECVIGASAVSGVLQCVHVHIVIEHLIAGEYNTAEPDDGNDDSTVSASQLRLERVVDHVEAVQANGDQCKHVYVDV